MRWPGNRASSPERPTNWRKRSAEPLWTYLLAGALLTGGPVWHYLYVNGYPFQRPEALLLPLTAGACGAAAGSAAFVLGRNVGSVMFGLLLLVFLDLQFDISAWPIRTAAVAAACIGVAFLLRSHRAAITCLALAAFNVAALPRSPHQSAPPRPSRYTHSAEPPPLLVHIVLDEQWGIGGVRAAGDTALANYLTDFYVRRGFTVFEAAYSRWEETWRSIPALFSLGGATADVQVRPGPTFRLASNPYFDRLRQLGYDVHVFQSTYVDYCSAAGTAVASCDEVPAVSIANVGYLPGEWTDRLTIASRFFLNLNSYVYTKLHADGPKWRRSFAGRGIAQLEDARDVIIGNANRGTAVFIHLLMPHQPLELDERCTIGERFYHYGSKDLNDAEWRRYLALYSDQVRCVHRALDDVIAAVDRAAGRDRSIIIVHGDHGSRISKQHRVDDSVFHLNREQLNSAFSTLLAVRTPGIPASLRTDAVPVQDYFRELVRLEFAQVGERTWRQFVVETDDADRPAPVAVKRMLGGPDMSWVRPHAAGAVNRRPAG